MRGLPALLALVVPALVAACGRPPPARLPAGPPVDLRQPADRASPFELVRLRDDPQRCRALLEAAGARIEAVEPVTQGACGHRDALRFAGGRLGSARLAGTVDLPLACPVAAALLLWERDVLQPAARRHLGSPITRIDHFGSYACRGIESSARLSEHARANAIDIAGFHTADGRRITLVEGWSGDRATRAFLRAARDGACRLFATTLSPDADAAHRDHFHLDQADRGAHVRAICR